MNNILRKILGVATVILLYLSFATGIIAIFKYSILMAALYFIFILIMQFAVAYSFCTKCPCRLDCAHFVFGMLTRILPERKPAAYSTFDIIGVVIALAVLVIFPQFYLIKNIALLSSFWALIIIPGIIIPQTLCKTCQNKNCPVCRNKKLKTGC